MPRKVPTDPKLYKEALARVRAGLRHRIITDSVDRVNLIGNCEACGPDQKIYTNGEWFTCANYYVDKQLRTQLKESGERVPPPKRGRLKVSEIQRPINLEYDPTDEYIPWLHRDFATHPLDGFDPRSYPRPEHAPRRIEDYLDQQAAAQQHRCALCGNQIRKIFSGGNTERRTYAVAMVRMPRGGHTQVRFSDEVFCIDCKDTLERSNPNPAWHARMAEVMAHFAGLKQLEFLDAPINDPSIQNALLKHLD